MGLLLAAVLAGCASPPPSPPLRQAPPEPAVPVAQRYSTSFDCRQIETPVQHFVCRDADLAALDVQLGQLWRDQLRLQDQAGRAELLASHRLWQRGLYPGCQVGEKGAEVPPENAILPARPLACLRQAWQARIAALQAMPAPRVVAKAGGVDGTAAHPLSAYVAFRPVQSLEPALCSDLGARFDGLIAQRGALDVTTVPGWQPVAGMRGPASGRLPDGRSVDVATQDAGPYGSYELRATGLRVDGRPLVDDTTVPRWLRDLPNGGGSFSDTSSQTRDYAGIEVFLKDGRPLVLVNQTWGYYAAAARGESPHAAVYELDAQGALQRRCLWRTYTTPPVAQALRFLPQFKALQEVLAGAAGPDSPRLPPNDRRDAGLLAKEAQWHLLNMPLLALREADRHGRWPLLRQRHDEALEAVFAWSERNVPSKLLYRRLMPLLPVAHAELLQAYQGSEGLTADEARGAADLLLMATLARAAERLQDPALPRPAVVSAVGTAGTAGTAYTPHYAVAPVPGALERGRDYAGLHSALLNRASPEAIDAWLRSTWGSAERIGNPALGRGPAGDTPLMAAVRSPDTMARLLAAGADVNGRNDWGKTALMTAAQADQLDSLQRLLAAGADLHARTTAWQSDGAGGPDNAEGANAGWTALMHAAAQASPAVIDALLSAGADRAGRDAQGQRACELLNGNALVDAAGQARSRSLLCTTP